MSYVEFCLSFIIVRTADDYKNEEKAGQKSFVPRRLKQLNLELIMVSRGKENDGEVQKR